MNMAISSSEHFQNHVRMALQHVVAAFKPGAGSGLCSMSVDFHSSSLVYSTLLPLRNQVYLPRSS